MRALGILVITSCVCFACLAANGQVGEDTADTAADTTESDTSSSDTAAPDTTSPDEVAAPDASDPGLPETTGRCPVASFTIAEGELVAPGTILHLDGTASRGVDAPVVGYAWRVERPPGSVDTFSPSAYVASPILITSLTGTYRIHLSVTDAHGVRSCESATRTVHVVDHDGIRIELTWTNPHDPDDSDVGDDAGPDVDLHYAHPLAVGGYDGDGDGLLDPWFDLPYDCFWHNHAPNWGSITSDADNPQLLEDTTRGGGEALVHPAPEPGTYRVAVHHWDDRGLGPSFATVRIFAAGQLLCAVEHVSLAKSDLWEVATITWPATGADAEVHRVCADAPATAANTACAPCEPRIIPRYRPPEFFQP